MALGRRFPAYRWSAYHEERDGRTSGTLVPGDTASGNGRASPEPPDVGPLTEESYPARIGGRLRKPAPTRAMSAIATLKGRVGAPARSVVGCRTSWQGGSDDQGCSRNHPAVRHVLIRLYLEGVAKEAETCLPPFVCWIFGHCGYGLSSRAACGWICRGQGVCGSISRLGVLDFVRSICRPLCARCGQCIRAS